MYCNFLFYIFIFILGFQNTIGDDCPPLPAEAVKITKTGQKAWDKCIELAETVYPCKRSPTIQVDPPLVRTRSCLHTATPLIQNGEEVKPGEIPHLGLLGFGVPARVSGVCGGNLISESWVLTTSLCTELFGNVKTVKFGGYSLDATVEPRFLYNITRIVKHPLFRSDGFYNDIALVQLDRPVEIDEYIRPACLHTGGQLTDLKYIFAGWGRTSVNSTLSNTLQKVVVENFPHDVCSAVYRNDKGLPLGVDESTMMCAGHFTEDKGGCRGDGGGAVMVYNNAVDCTYTIIGINSFAYPCDEPGRPAISSRVSYYVPWIESVVWP